jgi:hypothetical protein
MSHILTLKQSTTVKFKSLELLQQACEAIQGATIGSTFKDYYKTEVKVDLSIRTQAVSRGIGFVKVGDEYAIKADPYGATKETHALVDEISRNYQKLGHLQILSKYRYSTSVLEDKEGVLIEGRQYS